MIVNFEFLSNEQIENVITSLNYQVDKVICFGYPDCIERRFASAAKFLKKYCGVKQVESYPLSEKDLDKTLCTLRKMITAELERGSKLYFDITGGESLSLIALGMLTEEFGLPIHGFDVRSNKLTEFNPQVGITLSAGVPARRIELTVEKYIELYGGIVNKRFDGDISLSCDETDGAYKLMMKYNKKWNSYLSFIQSNISCDENLRVKEDPKRIIKLLDGKFRPCDFNAFLEDLETQGLIKELKNSDGIFSFRIVSEGVKRLLWNGGKALELEVLKKQKQISNYSMSGVHIDWDGVIHYKNGVDVHNEIDVLSVSGNVPTFISCKSGLMNKDQALDALYELETVAERFGGKYAVKQLVTINNCREVYKQRAEEMGIEFKVINGNGSDLN